MTTYYQNINSKGNTITLSVNKTGELITKEVPFNARVNLRDDKDFTFAIMQHVEAGNLKEITNVVQQERTQSGLVNINDFKEEKAELEKEIAELQMQLDNIKIVNSDLSRENAELKTQLESYKTHISEEIKKEEKDIENMSQTELYAKCKELKIEAHHKESEEKLKEKIKTYLENSGK
jgi:hypothetical protein